MEFSGKMCFKIIIKVTKNQGFTLFLENTFFEKPQKRGGEGGGQIDSLSRFRVNPAYFELYLHSWFVE